MRRRASLVARGGDRKSENTELRLKTNLGLNESGKAMMAERKVKVGQ